MKFEQLMEAGVPRDEIIVNALKRIVELDPDKTHVRKLQNIAETALNEIGENK